MLERLKDRLGRRMLRLALIWAKNVTPAPRPQPLVTRGADLFGWRAYRSKADLMEFEAVQLWRLRWARPLTVFPEALADPGSEPGCFWRPLILPAVNRDAVSFGMQRN